MSTIQATPQIRLTTKRQLSGIHFLFDQDGNKVGESWRGLGGNNKFGLRLNGIYWLKGQPTRRGGSTTIARRRLRDCVALAEQTLNSTDLQAS
jgi:hypothetical protein